MIAALLFVLSVGTLDYDFFLPVAQKDVAFLPWLLKSIDRFNYTPKGFYVVVPPQDVAVIKPILPPTAQVIVRRDMISNSGYLSQQAIKLYADRYGNAQFIIILEADMVFTKNSPSCFWKNDKIKSYCLRVDESNNMWAKGTSFSLRLPKLLQTTCVTVTPFAFPRSVFAAYRNFIRAQHNQSVIEHVTTFVEAHNKGWTPENNMYSEFEQLSAYMAYYAKDLVHRVDFGRINHNNLCSSHTGSVVKRVDGLENPKLTAEYFRLAAKAMTSSTVV